MQINETTAQQIADSEVILDLVNRLGTLESIDALCAALTETLALRGASDADIAAIQAIGDDANRRRRAAK